MTATRFVPCALAGALLLASAVSEATPWQWRDAQGRMVYSDRAPPADVRSSQILRSPVSGKAATGTSPVSSTPTDTAPPIDGAAASPAKASAGTAPSWVERERAFRQRTAEREANEAKQRDEAERTATTKRACDELRREIRTLESGMRVVTLNTRGEPEPLEDAQRAQRLKTARADLARVCADR